jgi:hypothetical protein
LKSTALILLTTAAFATSVSGCSTKDPGQARAELSATDAAAPGASGSDIDLSKFAKDPCQLLTIDQLNAPDKIETEVYDGPLGPTCIWSTKDLKRPGYKVALSTKRPLEVLKEKSKDDKTFRETTVAGRPAFVHDFGDGKGTCATTVSTSDKDAVVVSMGSEFRGNPEYEIACDISEKLAGLVVEKLKG